EIVLLAIPMEPEDSGKVFSILYQRGEVNINALDFIVENVAWNLSVDDAALMFMELLSPIADRLLAEMTSVTDSGKQAQATAIFAAYKILNVYSTSAG
ncbi:MAG: hypothetical protein AAFZ92_08355, partial [Pseudomonadota bacterium]